MSSNTSTCHTESSFHAVRACQILKVSVFGGLRSFCVLPRPAQPQSAINYTHSAEKLKFSSERSLTGFSSMCTSVQRLLDVHVSFVPCTCPPLPLFGTKMTQSQRVALKAPYNEVESSLLWRYTHTYSIRHVRPTELYLPHQCFTQRHHFCLHKLNGAACSSPSLSTHSLPIIAPFHLFINPARKFEGELIQKQPPSISLHLVGRLDSPNLFKWLNLVKVQFSVCSGVWWGGLRNGSQCQSIFIKSTYQWPNGTGSDMHGSMV